MEEVTHYWKWQRHTGKQVQRARNECLMELLYASGMRISELMSLPVSTARGSPKMILIKGKGSKERFVHPHHPLLMHWIGG